MEHQSPDIAHAHHPTEMLDFLTKLDTGLKQKSIPSAEQQRNPWRCIKFDILNEIEKTC